MAGNSGEERNPQDVAGERPPLEEKKSFFTAAFRSSAVGEDQPLLDVSKSEAEANDPLLEKEDCATYHVRKGLGWFRILDDTYGTKLLISLFLIQHLTKGFAMSWISNALNYYFRDLGNINSSTIQTYTAVVMTPWCVKGVFGMLSDTVSIRGYQKGPWITMTALGCVCASLYIGLYPMNSISIAGALGCLTAQQLHIAWSDLLTEAKYSESIRKRPKRGSDLISYIWGGVSIAQFASVATVGILIEFASARGVFALASIPCALGLFVGILNLLEERRAEGSPLLKLNCDKIRQYSNYMALVFILTGISLTLAVLGIVSTDTRLNCIVAVSLGVLVFLSFFALADPLVAKTNTFFLLCACCYVSIEGATFYFFTDTPSQYPDGPHFSATFYTTGIGLVASSTSVFGIWMYNRYFSTSKYRTIFLVNGIVWTTINLISCAVFLRWNLKVGIPDELFVLGSQALQQMVLQLGWIPGVVLMSHLCHEGMEATMYALMAGSQNLGSNISYFTGAYILEALKVQPSGNEDEGHQFENLWLVAVFSALGGLIPLLFLPLLIPDARPDERLVHR